MIKEIKIPLMDFHPKNNLDPKEVLAKLASSPDFDGHPENWTFTLTGTLGNRFISFFKKDLLTAEDIESIKNTHNSVKAEWEQARSRNESDLN